MQGKKSVQTSQAKRSPKVKPVAHGIGRRKKSVARVWLRKGNGTVTVNGIDYQLYFDTEITRLEAVKPFKITPLGSSFDVEANVSGGGKTGQAGAVRLGLARALLETDDSIKSTLRDHGLLTVDSRQKERKKYGQRSARRKFQFVKR